MGGDDFFSVFSGRTHLEKSPNRLTARLESLRALGLGVNDLTESNPTRCGFRYLKNDLLLPLADPASLTYEPSPKGLPGSREAVAGYYHSKGIGIDPGDIFLTSSTSEAYGFIFRLLLNAGDRILVPRPSYPLLDFLAMFHDVRTGVYMLDPAADWQNGLMNLAPPDFEQARALVLVNPNNPTGNYIEASERDWINRFAAGHGLSLIVDEVFHDFFLGHGPVPESFASNRDVLTFTLSGLSKTLGLPQMKLGWIVLSGPGTLKKEAASRLEVLTDIYLSVNTPVQHAVPLWLGMREAIGTEIRNRVRENYALLERTFTGTALRLFPAQGGWYAVLGLPGDYPPDEDFALLLLDREKVLVHPGYLFDFEGDRFLVVSLIVESPVLAEGAGKILTAYSSFS